MMQLGKRRLSNHTTAEMSKAKPIPLTTFVFLISLLLFLEALLIIDIKISLM